MARILVAEPDPQARHYLSSLLEHAGHEVVGVAGGDAALRALVSERIDVAVTELRLPGLTGAGLVRAAARVDEHLACLVLGGFGDLGAIDDALLAGAIGVIPKPATACQVVCCVERASERRRFAAEANRGRLSLRGIAAPSGAARPV